MAQLARWTAEAARGLGSRAATALSDVLDDRTFIKRAAVAVALMQATLTLLAAASGAVLFGDGAFFAFAIAADNEWGLLWSRFACRAAAYVLTAAPVSVIYFALGLSGEALVRLYSFWLNAVVLLQFLALMALSWRRFPELLWFPVVGYACGVGLGYGFASEMLFASGFFWMAMFAIADDRPSPALLTLSFVAMLFSHELAVLAVPIVLLFAYLRRDAFSDPPSRAGLAVFVGAACAAVLAWAWLKASGASSGGTHNMLYVVDPRRLLGNPTVWLIGLAVALTALYAHVRRRPNGYDMAVASLLAFVGTLASSHWLNVFQGRYDSARTLMAASLVLLGGLFILAHQPLRASTRPAPPPRLDPSLVKLALAVALAANFASNLSFIYRWEQARETIEAAVGQAGSGAPGRFISVDALAAARGADAARLGEMGFAWTLPFASIMSAEDLRPARIIANPDAVYWICERRGFSGGPASRVPASTFSALRRYACAQPAPPPPQPLLSRIWRLLF
jgi:hypothetical protein